MPKRRRYRRWQDSRWLDDIEETPWDGWIDFRFGGGSFEVDSTRLINPSESPQKPLSGDTFLNINVNISNLQVLKLELLLFSKVKTEL